MIKSPVFLAVVLLLLTLAAVGYQAFELNKIRLGKSMSASEPQQMQKKHSPAADSVPSLALLAKRNLMGTPNKSPKQPSAESALPISSLKLILMGTITQTDTGMNSAFIQGNNRETKRYYVGQMVDGGFILDSVAVDSVVLKRNEQLETLKYPLNVLTAPATPASSALPVAKPVVNRPAQQNTPAAGAPTPPVAQPMSLRERMRNSRNNNTQPNAAGK